jgi:hypothetical protein
VGNKGVLPNRANDIPPPESPLGMTAPPQPDLQLAERLADQGYWVFPTVKRQKGCRTVLNRPWGWYYDNQEHNLLSSQLSANSVTGAAISLSPSDPVPLLILDYDLDHPAPWEQVWEESTGGLPVPQNLAITQSTSGGYHFWFQLPDAKTKLPDKFRFTENLQGEIRASSRPKTMLMLPGSVAINKAGNPGSYAVVHGSLEDLAQLPVPPTPLTARLMARPTSERTQMAEEEDGIPTEVAHLLEVLTALPAYQKGEMNTRIAQVGQMIGRMYPRENLPEHLLAKLWDILKEKLDRDFDQKSFRKAVNSGWKTGRANAGKYQAREKHPTVSDVDLECRALFGGELWMKRMIDSTGKEVGIIIGVGASAKRPEEADVTVSLNGLDEVLPSLARVCKSDPDIVVRNPLFIQPGWRNVLEFALKQRSSIEPLGLPPEDIFFERVNDWARRAAADQFIVQGWSESRDWDKSSPFLVCPRGTNDAVLTIPEQAHERLLRSIGDIALAKRLANKFLLKKNLTGRAKGWTIDVNQLDKGTLRVVQEGHSRLIASKLKK